MKMSTAQLLGVIHLESPVRVEPPTDPGLGSDLPFWKDVSQIVHDILARAYVTSPEYARAEAARRGLTVEQLISSSIAYRIMSKVDLEYV
jgi:hypothetical protein